MEMDLDNELESNPEYRRVLAELPPDERIRLLGLDFNLQRQLAKKREYRRALAKMSPVEKLRLLEELRKRAEVQRGLRDTPQPNPAPSAAECGTMQSVVREAKVRDLQLPPRRDEDAFRLGGRATASGVNYEVRIAAFVAAKMLVGSRSSAWEGISGSEIAAITMQAAEPVDDVVVNLAGDVEARVFISAKQRSGNVPLTASSPAFAETVDAFVRQFLKLSASARTKGRLVWAVPDCVGTSATHDLPSALKEHREAGEVPFSEFFGGRRTRQRKALDALATVAREAWKKQVGHAPTEAELRQFLRQVFVEVLDFSSGKRLVREIEGEVSSHVVADPKEAQRAWEKLEHFFLQADCHGVPVTRVSLRKALVAAGIALQSPSDYAGDIAKLRELTARNLSRLKDHTTLRFGPDAADAIHISRADELSALLAAAKSTSLLISGEPGCGKSGLIDELARKLQDEGFPVVLLLAEEAFIRDWKGAANVPELAHSLAEVLCNWPDGKRGFLVTDALDAVRETEPQKALRRLLQEVREGPCGWAVIASVRVFDLKHSRELRESFPGTGVPGYVSDEFAGVAHFHLPRLSEAQLDELVAKRPDILPFITNARRSAKSEHLHHSPFHLRLAAELLQAGVTPAQLADWHSPAMLLRKFWEARITAGAGTAERENVLKAVCRQMVETRRMAVSLKLLPLSAPERSHVDELRSRGILVPPPLRQGVEVGGDEIRFTHHLLHDYAIARSLIPETPGPFCDFSIHEKLLPIFYRQSFIFALEELWDVDEQRGGFWESALRLEGATQLYGVTRILAPLLAARRVESLADLQPLLAAVRSDTDPNSAGQKALRHLVAGLQDADPVPIRTGAAGWCAFAVQLACLVETCAAIEWPLVQIIARLTQVNAATDAHESLALNAAARTLLAHHVKQKVAKERQYLARVAIETVCRTFRVAPAESESALVSLLTPERLAQFPHHDLHDLADNLKRLGSGGDRIVFQLFDAAFALEPEPGQYETTGSAIMSMSFQTSDQWNMIHYALAGYYEARSGDNAALMTEAACIAWNAVVRRRSDRRNRDELVLATIRFRGVPCQLIEDYGHIWGREFEHEENRILSHFEELLNQWAAAGDTARLNAALDHFAARNRTSLMWMVFLEAGAAHPLNLGALLHEVLSEPLFLTHPDYSYGGTALLGALHKAGDTVQREKLEQLILDLPKNARLRHEEDRWPTPSWVEHAQNRLLGVLEEPNIVLARVRELRRARQQAEELPANPKPEGPRVISHTYSDQELVERRGINLQDPANLEMYRLREALKPFLGRDNKKVEVNEIESHWAVIQQCEAALEQHSKRHPQMAEELRGHLVSACENLAVHAEWPSTDERWRTVRQILLKATTDRVPEAYYDEDAKEDRWPSWGWPAPRLDASRGLPFLAYRLGEVDSDVAAALRRLCRDKSHPLRFNLADRLAVLAQPAPDFMWELVDLLIAEEQKFSVLDMLVLSLDRLWASAPEEVKPRLQRIAERAMQSAAEENHIHETLAHTHLFRFLRTGDPDCEGFILRLIAECDSQRASHALGAQLHACRSGGWLTAGDGVNADAYADAVRARTWSFFSRLLGTAQARLAAHYETLRQLHQHGAPDTEAVKPAREKLERVTRLVDAVAMQLYFASGALDEKNHNPEHRLTAPQLRRFWQEAAPLFRALAGESHPHTAHQLVEALHYLLPCAPRDIFLIATQSILSGARAGMQYESLAVGDVVSLIQRALADYRDLFRPEAGKESECLVALLQALDLFVEAGWTEARQLTHRLEEIYR
jgi:hypothetical protein